MEASLLRSTWHSPWLRPLNDVGAIDDLLARVHPTWALGRIKARVVKVVLETPDTRTFVVRPNRNWPGSKGGQHVLLEAEIGGVRHQRRYSLSGAPGAARAAALTVKRQPGGKVSNWLHDHVHVGDVLTLGPPAGAFVLPDPLPERLLLLSAGSGITPLMSMLHDLHQRTYTGEVAFVHVCRSREDVIFGDELAALADTWPRLTLHTRFSGEAGRLDAGMLARLVPDHAARHTFMCGPQGFMAMFREYWQTRGLAARLQCEHFAVPDCSAAPGDAVQVRCVRSERAFDALGSNALLVEAERAGLQPRHGCRVGICHTCQFVKRSGTVENLLTGRISSEPNERIQLCISRARSDLVLEL